VERLGTATSPHYTYPCIAAGPSWLGGVDGDRGLLQRRALSTGPSSLGGVDRDRGLLQRRAASVSTFPDIGLTSRVIATQRSCLLLAHDACAPP
jgi:hypothetical protein